MVIVREGKFSEWPEKEIHTDATVSRCLTRQYFRITFHMAGRVIFKVL
jgi:hypothetical protein